MTNTFMACGNHVSGIFFLSKPGFKYCDLEIQFKMKCFCCLPDLKKVLGIIPTAVFKNYKEPETILLQNCFLTKCLLHQDRNLKRFHSRFDTKLCPLSLLETLFSRSCTDFKNLWKSLLCLINWIFLDT